MKNRDLIRDAMMFAVKDITGRVLREATVQSMIDDFEKQLTIPVVSDTLILTPKDAEVFFNEIMNPKDANEALKKAMLKFITR